MNDLKCYIILPQGHRDENIMFSSRSWIQPLGEFEMYVFGFIDCGRFHICVIGFVKTILYDNDLYNLCIQSICVIFVLGYRYSILFMCKHKLTLYTLKFRDKHIFLCF